MELRFVDRREFTSIQGEKSGRILKRLQVRQMEQVGEEWSLGPWQDVPFVRPEDE